MAITAQLVKELREKSGAGMMDCKKALTESDGDMDKALKILREKGMAAASKRAGKIAAEGVISIVEKDDKIVAVEVNCETDFVSKGDDFANAAKGFADAILNSSTTDVESFLKDSLNDGTVESELAAIVGKIGENIKIRRFKRFEKTGSQVFGQYIHMGGKIGVAVKVSVKEGADVAVSTELAKDICMHIAAADPKYLSSEDVSQEDMDTEKDIYANQMRNQGKPENIIGKIVEGKMKKYYEEVCLLNQVFVKDTDKTITQLLSASGTEMKIEEFVRFKVGDGIEKKETNLAEEVQAEINKNK